MNDCKTSYDFARYFFETNNTRKEAGWGQERLSQMTLLMSIIQAAMDKQKHEVAK